MRVCISILADQVASADVVVNLLDRNDNAPVFSLAEYRVAIRENVAPGTKILQVGGSRLRLTMGLITCPSFQFFGFPVSCLPATTRLAIVGSLYRTSHASAVTLQTYKLNSNH